MALASTNVQLPSMSSYFLCPLEVKCMYSYILYRITLFVTDIIGEVSDIRTTYNDHSQTTNEWWLLSE